jgi:hypothetical protein
MKLFHVELNPEVRVAALNNQGSFLDVGASCSPAFGGGTIASLEYDRKEHSLIVRKTCPFKGPIGNKAFDFEYVAIPWANVRSAYGLTEAQVQQPGQASIDQIAKPIPAQPKVQQVK